MFHPSINNYFSTFWQTYFPRVGFACLRIKAKKITKIAKILHCLTKMLPFSASFAKTITFAKHERRENLILRNSFAVSSKDNLEILKVLTILFLVLCSDPELRRRLIR